MWCPVQLCALNRTSLVQKNILLRKLLSGRKPSVFRKFSGRGRRGYLSTKIEDHMLYLVMLIFV
jgi:hypothetical protein